MASAENVQTLSATAGEAIAIYRFISLQSDGKYDVGVGTDDFLADGVSAEAAAADGDLFAMAPCGQPAIMKLEAAEAIAVGALVGAEGSTGKALTANAVGASKYSHGRALDEAVNDGDIIRVLLHVAGRQV
jgi:hypothetical protein